MERSQLRQEITHIKSIADAALRVAREDDGATQPVHETVAALNMDVNAVLNATDDGRAESRVVESIDLLEASADRAKQALARAPRISEETRDAVLRVHDEISRLKHQLH